MKKIISFLLVAIMLLSLMCACSSNAGAADTDGAAGNNATNDTDAATEELPDLPEGVKYQDYEFNILVAGTLHYSDFDIEENDGSYEQVNLAITERNKTIEDKYGIVISSESHFGTSFGDGPGYKQVFLDYQANECLYDLCMVGTYDAAQLALGLHLADLNSTKYIDLDKSWWDQKANEDLEINGVQFFTTGDISFVDNICTHMIMFNKNLLTELDLTSPYTLVEQDAWDYDTFVSYVKQASFNLDGKDENTDLDRYGLLTWNDVIHQALHSSRQRVATINEYGYLSLTIYNATTVKLMEEYTTLFYDKENTYNYSMRNSQNEYDTVRKMIFDNGQALFYTTLFTTVPKHRDSATNFGIIPYPKFTETQSDYGHYISATHSQMMCIEAIHPDLDMVSMIVEDLAYYSKKTVTPAYYDDTLIGRQVRDDESVAMLDIIFASRVFDVGIYYKIGADQTIAANLTALLTSGQNTFASRYQSFAGPSQTMIDRINEQYDSLRD